MRKLFHGLSNRDVAQQNGETDPETMKGNDEAPSEEDLNNLNSEVLADQNKSIIWSIIKQLKIGESVKHLQLPTFVLQPRSLLEKLTDSLVHPEIIQDISRMDNPQQRFMAVLQFYVGGWHYRQPGVRNPLNPVIGEIFRCKWSHGDSESVYFAEQLSHHPPHSAFVYYNAKRGYALNANLAPTYVTFKGNSAETHIQGILRLHVFGKKFDEEIYEMTYPSMIVKGILFGALTYEVVGKTIIRCLSTGYEAEFDFKQKSMFRGKINAVGGKVKHGKDILYLINGFWDSIIYLQDANNKDNTGVLFDNTQHKIAEKIVPPKEQQAPNESRRLWEDVIREMLKNDEDEALAAKRKLEATQRAEENERVAKRIEWQPKLFVKNSEGIYYYYKWNDVVKEIRDARAHGSM